MKTQVFSTGPNGEKASPASGVALTPDEIAKVKAMHATAAIVLHYAGNDWSRAQVEGLKAEFSALGIDVIAVTDAGFKPETQVADIETVMAKKPSVIASIPVDPVSEAAAYKKAADAGVKLVFMDNVPKGLVAGKDYVSVVSADNYGNGVAAGLLMAKFLKGKGTIGADLPRRGLFCHEAALPRLPEGDRGIPGHQGHRSARDRRARLLRRRRQGRFGDDHRSPRYRRHLGRLGRSG